MFVFLSEFQSSIAVKAKGNISDNNLWVHRQMIGVPGPQKLAPSAEYSESLNLSELIPQLNETLVKESVTLEWKGSSQLIDGCSLSETVNKMVIPRQRKNKRGRPLGIPSQVGKAVSLNLFH
jgi:hypothetical protein